MPITRKHGKENDCPMLRSILCTSRWVGTCGAPRTTSSCACTPTPAAWRKSPGSQMIPGSSRQYLFKAGCVVLIILTLYWFCSATVVVQKSRQQQQFHSFKIQTTIIKNYTRFCYCLVQAVTVNASFQEVSVMLLTESGMALEKTY